MAVILAMNHLALLLCSLPELEPELMGTDPYCVFESELDPLPSPPPSKKITVIPKKHPRFVLHCARVYACIPIKLSCSNLTFVPKNIDCVCVRS